MKWCLSISPESWTKLGNFSRLFIFIHHPLSIPTYLDTISWCNWSSVWYQLWELTHGDNFIFSPSLNTPWVFPSRNSFRPSSSPEPGIWWSLDQQGNPSSLQRNNLSSRRKCKYEIQFNCKNVYITFTLSFMLSTPFWYKLPKTPFYIVEYLW